uniref:Hypothetical conserved protein n=1 Tax=uncultured Planctomycetota bacterium TaxID=120965 RepID=H5SLZ2_9BACT|nr:hypothetical conserved protein [uncultured Planctomycetota bacterium]
MSLLKLLCTWPVLCSALLLTRLSAYSAAPPAGTWKLTVYQSSSELDLCLVKIIAEDNQRWRATVIARGVPDLDLVAEKLSITGRKLVLTLNLAGNSYTVTATMPEQPAVNILYGVFGRRPDMLLPVILERTDQQELDPKKSVRQSPANKAFVEAVGTANQERQRELLRTLLKQHGENPIAIFATVQLITLLADIEGQTKEIQGLAQDALHLAAKYGPALEGNAAWRIGEALLNSSKNQDLAPTYLERAISLFSAEAPASFRARLHKILAKAYRVSGQAAKAQALMAKIEALERQADDEYRRSVPPFPVHPVQPRKEPGRAVVLELFTGTQCPPCVAADVAFDAIGRTYSPTQVILLQYHLHIPRADPLTNPDTIKRSEFYQVQGTPTALINGKPTSGLGGPMQYAESRYKTLLKLINAHLQAEPPCHIDLQVRKQDHHLDIEATVSGYKNMPEKARLLFVLVEKEVRYPAPNEIRFHHHVVRAIPGGHEGFALEKDKTRQSVRVDLVNLEKDLRDYLNRYARETPFPDDEQPLELRHLRVIALIQDLATREILHAALADVPD